jgi:hypothetical protein
MDCLGIVASELIASSTYKVWILLEFTSDACERVREAVKCIRVDKSPKISLEHIQQLHTCLTDLLNGGDGAFAPQWYIFPLYISMRSDQWSLHL